MHVRLNSVAPTFLVADVGATIRWYEQNLGFTSYPFPKQEPYVFASVARDQAEIMLMLVAGYQKPDLRPLRPAGLWDAYIRMDGVTTFYEQVRTKVPILMPPTKQRYGDTEFEIMDPNGYILVFSELIGEGKTA